jgi:predicted nucleotidyltransferase component of viral defense system
MPLIQFPDSLQPELLDLLKKIMHRTVYRQFALGGGTSLALRYGHRSSIDIDLFSTDAFDTMELQNQITLELPNHQIVSRTKGSLCVYSEDIKIDFLHHPFPLLETIDTEGPYRFLSVPDISAMKINAVTNRGSKKDFVDLYLLHLNTISLSRSLDNFANKYNGNKLLALRSLLWFDDAEDEPDPLFLNNWTWDLVRNEIQKAAETIIVS